MASINMPHYPCCTGLWVSGLYVAAAEMPPIEGAGSLSPFSLQSCCVCVGVLQQFDNRSSRQGRGSFAARLRKNCLDTVYYIIFLVFQMRSLYIDRECRRD